MIFAKCSSLNKYLYQFNTFSIFYDLLYKN